MWIRFLQVMLRCHRHRRNFKGIQLKWWLLILWWSLNNLFLWTCLLDVEFRLFLFKFIRWMWRQSHGCILKLRGCLIWIRTFRRFGRFNLFFLKTDFICWLILLELFFAGSIDQSFLILQSLISEHFCDALLRSLFTFLWLAYNPLSLPFCRFLGRRFWVWRRIFAFWTNWWICLIWRGHMVRSLIWDKAGSIVLHSKSFDIILLWLFKLRFAFEVWNLRLLEWWLSLFLLVLIRQNRRSRSWLISRFDLILFILLIFLFLSSGRLLARLLCCSLCSFGVLLLLLNMLSIIQLSFLQDFAWSLWSVISGRHFV